MSYGVHFLNYSECRLHYYSNKWKVLGANCMLAFATLNKGWCLIKEYPMIKLWVV